LKVIGLTIICTALLCATTIENKSIQDIEKLEKDGNARIVTVEDYNKEREAARIEEVRKQNVQLEKKAEVVVEKEFKEIVNQKEQFFKQDNNATSAKVEQVDIGIVTVIQKPEEQQNFAIDGKDNYIESLKDILVDLEKSKKALELLKLHGFNKVRVWNEFEDFKNKIETQIAAIKNQE